MVCRVLPFFMNPEVRVRFAPSPTGYLHVGGARTALFNWLYARHCGGRFILRIEDTDKARNTEAAVQVILDGLAWLGLDWDEGPLKGGSCGPYFQSAREDIYLRYFERLRGGGYLYEDQGAWRFRSPRQKVTVPDLICGSIEFDLSNPATHPDMTIRRADGSWIFHFVNVVDDIEMRISHVIRGEDHLSNTPKHLELFSALGEPPPKYAHIPLILNKNGSKMSKRDEGASITSYLDNGYVPEAVRNYLTLLGWSPKDGREILDLSETVESFELEKVHRKNAQFDLEKCTWLNGQYLLKMEGPRFIERAVRFLRTSKFAYADHALLPTVLELVKEKIKIFSELAASIGFFFTDEFIIDEGALAKAFAGQHTRLQLAAVTESFAHLDAWSGPALETALKETALKENFKPNSLLLPIRVAVSGRSGGPSLFPMLETLGREKTIQRLRNQHP